MKKRSVIAYSVRVVCAIIQLSVGYMTIRNPIHLLSIHLASSVILNAVDLYLDIMKVEDQKEGKPENHPDEPKVSKPWNSLDLYSNTVKKLVRQGSRTFGRRTSKSNNRIHVEKQESKVSLNGDEESFHTKSARRNSNRQSPKSADMVLNAELSVSSIVSVDMGNGVVNEIVVGPIGHKRRQCVNNLVGFDYESVMHHVNQNFYDVDGDMKMNEMQETHTPVVRRISVIEEENEEKDDKNPEEEKKSHHDKRSFFGNALSHLHLIRVPSHDSSIGSHHANVYDFEKDDPSILTG
jgi:hypothetical protein